eukprot:g1582.t1
MQVFFVFVFFSFFEASTSEENIFLHLEEAVRLNPTDPDAHYKLGVAYKSKGRIPAAQKSFEAVVHLAGDNRKELLGRSLYSLGLLEQQYGGDLKKAQRYYSRCIAVDSQLTPAFVNLGIILKNTGQIQEAVEKLKTATELSPKNYNAWANYGVVLSQRGDAVEAVAAYQKALKIRPSRDGLQARSNLATELKAQHRLHEAVDMYASIWKIQPHSALLEAVCTLLAPLTFIEPVQGLPDASKCLEKGQEMFLSQVSQFRKTNSCPVRLITDWLEEASRKKSNPMVEMVQLFSARNEKNEIKTYGRNFPFSLEEKNLVHFVVKPGDLGFTREQAKEAVERTKKSIDGSELDERRMYFERDAFVVKFNNVAVEGASGIIHDDTHSPPGNISKFCKIYLPVHRLFIPLTEQFKPSSESLITVSKAANLLQMLAYHFFHWIAECLPRLLLIEESGLLKNEDVSLIVPGKQSSRFFIKQSLEILGYGNYKLIWFTPGMKVSVTALYSADIHLPKGEEFSDISVSYSLSPFHSTKHALELTRKRFVSRSESNTENDVGSYVIVLSRNEPGWKTRTSSNEAEIITALKAALPSSVTVLRFRGQESTLRSAVHLFSNAKVVIGIHGGAMSNLIFCKRGTTLIEVALAEPMYRHYMHLAAALDLNYWIAGAPLPPGNFEKANFSFPVDEIVSIAAAVLTEKVEL